MEKDPLGVFIIVLTDIKGVPYVAAKKRFYTFISKVNSHSCENRNKILPVVRFTVCKG